MSRPRVVTVYEGEGWWKDYDNACHHAALHQGLAPIALRLAAANIPFTVDQTGGYCMAIGIYLTTDREHYIYVTNVAECIPDGATIDDLRWCVCRYFPEHDDFDEYWSPLAEGGTTEEATAAIAAELKALRTVGASPDVEGSEGVFRDAYAAGLAPMALSLAMLRVPFTVERTVGPCIALYVPLASGTAARARRGEGLGTLAGRVPDV